VTFLFTDIEGSTRLWQQGEKQMRAALSRHDELLRSAVAEHGGTVFSSMGDGIAAAFSAASAAVRAALSAQQLIEGESWPTATPLRVRMGLHTGEAEARDNDYFGTAVNRAARLMAVAHGGQVVCSAATAGVVDAEVELVDLGEHRLRDLDQPVQVFQVGGGSFAPLRSLDVLPGNLPSLASSFVGRHEELAALAEELGSRRLVTLTGVGGVGKTRLALQVAAELLPGFADGAWVCELAAAANGDEMAQVVASALGMAQRAQMTLDESIVDFLRTRQMLVVLDNCEHLLDAAAGLAEMILAGAPSVRMLATSREGLGISGEHVRPVRSLLVAVDADAAAGDAVVLFAERARAVAPEFTLDDARLAAVVEVCRRLDGIPLAIELAAARVATMTPAEIAGHLDERFRLLTGGRRGRVERHQTLRAAIEWSYSLLRDTERTVFDRLGVFPASFDETAAIAVCGSDLERWDVIDALTTLVAKSMLGVEQSPDTTRYQLLETMRHFARDRMAFDELDELRRRHAAHFAVFAELVGSGLVSPDELVWRPRLAADLDNFRAAVGWALDAPGLDDVDIGVRVLAALMPEVLTQPSRGIQAWARAASPRVAQLPADHRLVVLGAIAYDAYVLGDFETAKEYGRRVIAGTDVLTWALVPPFLAVCFSDLAGADPAAAMAVIDEGFRRLPREGTDARLAGPLHGFRFWVATAIGDNDTARDATERQLVLARHSGYPTGLAAALVGHAHRTFDERPEEALAAAEEAIGLVEAGAGDLAYSPALQIAAILRSERGDTASAARAVCAAIDHEAHIGNRTVLAADVLVAVVVLAGNSNSMDAAATLAGAINGPVLGHLVFFLGPSHRDRHERAVERAAAVLGAQRCAEAQRRGAAMTYDEIIVSALEQLACLADT